jgi:hypothetical protein
MQIKLSFASESHVPRFRAGVGTWRSGYMIPIRLPWRHRARPSATLHEIQPTPKGKLVFTMLHVQVGLVNQKLGYWATFILPRFNVIRGKAQLDGSRHNEALYALVERIQPQTGEPCYCHSPQLFRLQFHQDSSYTSHVPGDGGRRDRSAVERRGLSCPLGSLRAAEGGKSGSMRRVWLIYLICMTFVAVSVGVNYYHHRTFRNPLVIFCVLLGVGAGVFNFLKSK